MSEQAGEKTEQPTQRKLEESFKQGQFARSTEVRTVIVLMAGFVAIMFTGRETWRQLSLLLTSMLGHLHESTLTVNSVPGYAVSWILLFGKCVWPVVAATCIGALLAGGVQSRFQTASEVLEAKWERLDPVAGFKRIFSTQTLFPVLLEMLKLGAIIGLSYSEIKTIADDPIFFTPVSAARISEFLAISAGKIVLRICGALAVIAAMDYGYQFWKTNRDLMMTKEEVKEETKNSEGNPHVKSAQRRRRTRASKRQELMDVPKADVIITNPTHLSIALRYDRKTMRAPKIIAKGSRLNALRIREIAKQHQVPIIENKPLARMLFKHVRVGGEVPAQLYAAVAEVLAWVYRVNRYKYYVEQNQSVS